ncbi:hypothetical protein [Paraburkholderia bannensis]|uniref:hypothetical protein n=1 Tax=Paraburkholderia bannensis TaxID=765414 RepID=UPI002AB09FB6|nr:hypothetical protein [Paraburkholderia bannensis]
MTGLKTELKLLERFPRNFHVTALKRAVPQNGWKAVSRAALKNASRRRRLAESDARQRLTVLVQA